MNGIFARWGWVSLGGVVAMGMGAARADSPQPPDDLQSLVIPVDGKDSGAEVARRDMGESLVWPSREWARGQRPAGPNLPEWATKQRGYGVYGDLFGTGGYFALYEPKIADKSGMPTLALAERGDEEWKLRGVWTIQIDWWPQDERWAGTQVFYNKEEATRVPFELADVVGDKTPEVIVAGEMMKYRQAWYVMKYDAKTHGLELLACSEAKPVKVGNCMRLYSASGNKATWQEWRFLEWKEGKLSERAAWHSEIPYNDKESPYALAGVTPPGGQRKSYRIEQAAGGGENTRIYAVSESGRKIGTVAMEWKPGKMEAGWPELRELAWFFEKLTGLPREDFPETMTYTSYKDGKQVEHRDEKPERLETDATPRVEGGAEMNLLFSPKK